MRDELTEDPFSLIGERLSFGLPSCSLSDCASHFGLYEGKTEGLGMKSLLVFYNRLYKELASSFAQIYVYHKDEEVFIPTSTPVVNFYPYGITQALKTDKIEVQASLIFTGTNSLDLSASILGTNRCMTISPLILGTLKDHLVASANYDQSQGILRISLKVPRVDDRDPDPFFDAFCELKPTFNVKKVVFGKVLTPEEAITAASKRVFHGETPITYAILGKSVNLEAGKPERIFMTLRFWIDDYEPSELAAKKEPIRVARDRWNNIFKQAPKPRKESRSLRSLYYHAYQVLVNNLYAPIGLYGSHYACFPNKGNYDAHWLWDTAFHAFAILRFDEKLVQDTIEILLENQHEDGKIPHFLTVTWERPGPPSQPPILGLACWRYYLKTHDKDFLSEAYAKLSRSNEWWFENRDPDKDMLCEYFDGLESGWDNSPRWDKGKVEAADLNSFLVTEMKILSKIALELCLKDESQEWNEKTARLGMSMLNLMYDEETNLFYDLTSSNSFSKVMTPASFLPLWAGVPIERGRARAMIEQYLLNPKHFFGDIPFPVVAYSDHLYESSNFWRGPTWFNIAYFLLQTLHKFGYEREADETAHRLLQIAAEEPFICEYYDSQTGKGLGARSYGWTAATIIEMMLQSYKEPVV